MKTNTTVSHRSINVPLNSVLPVSWFLQPGWPVCTCLWRTSHWRKRLRSTSWKLSWMSWTRYWAWRTAAGSRGTPTVSHAANWASTSEQMFSSGIDSELQMDLLKPAMLVYTNCEGLLRRSNLLASWWLCVNHLSVHHLLVLADRGRERPII